MLNQSPTSAALTAWLATRERTLELARAIRRDGGRIMLKLEMVNPEYLDEPLRSQAIHFLQQCDSDPTDAAQPGGG